MQSAASLAPDLDRRVSALWRASLRPSFRELSRTAGSVLATLRDEGPARITDLAAAEAVAQPSMTSLVGRLERSGCVERRADPADGRAVLVAITDRGLETLERTRARRHELLTAALRALDRTERARIEAALPALDALIDHLKEPRTP